MFERYSDPARKAVFFARYEASVCGSRVIEAEHLLLGVLREDTGVAQRLLLSPTKIEAIRDRVRKQYPTRSKKISTSVDLPLSHSSKRALEHASEEAERMHHKYVGAEHLLLGLSLAASGSVPDILREYAITTAQLRSEAIQAGAPQAEPAPEPPRPSPAQSAARDISAAAEAGSLHPVIGREREIERLISILARRTRNSCALIGDAGIGKTAIVEALALRIANAQVPAAISERRLMALDAGSLIAGRQRHKPEEPLEDIVAGFLDSSRNLLFIRGLFNLAAGPSAWPIVEAMHVLEPHLAAGRLQCIVTGSPAGLRTTLERAPMLARHFEIVDVASVTEAEAIKILESLLDRFAAFHDVTFDSGVAEKAVLLSARAVPGRHLPDRAIDLIDEAATALKLKRAAEPAEVAAIRKKIRQLMRAAEDAIGRHDFAAARMHSDREHQERDRLEGLLQQFKSAHSNEPKVVRREHIEAAAAARIAEQKDRAEVQRILGELTGDLPAEAHEWMPLLAAYLARCSPAEAAKLAALIAAAKPAGSGS